MMFDVIIIGSGVAGASAGYFLTAAGKKVLILEKDNFPRYKTCGGGLISRAAKILPFDIDDVIECKITEAGVYDHSVNLHFQIKRKNPIINMTMRKDLDNFILNKAIDKGVNFLQEEVINIIQGEDYIGAITDNESFKGRFLIGADGATGITTRVLGIQKRFRRVPALECEVFADKSTLIKFNSTARFDFGIIPKGYGWLFPKKDHLSIGVLSFNNSGINLYRYLKKYLERLDITNINNQELHGYFIPFHNTNKKFVFGRILLAGDAAGLADPLTAEGISSAAESGHCAAAAILKSRNSVNLVYKNYEADINRILKELKYAGMLSRFFYSSSGTRNYVFKKYGDRLSNLMTDVITGDAQYSKLLKNPLNYLKLIFYRN